ncbi:glyoxalase [Pseudoxanthomonas jiangsuensis]|uniref:VOC family protein n=1 Tax=Pseudoxanthomonas jiangsuensis TaxID=619688 RepID=UPI00139188CE|nr:VOC family protein [Pseudoxanthomonas jiangsuensis]KAF1697272.1 glyoxalase [Pseudoxanthomonas jiangsuensis]
MTPALRLNGVHHTARPTWKLEETFRFYGEVMGLPLIHCVSARGWGPEDHPDFLHFFFDSGNGSTIAFFFYLGTEQPEHLVHRPHYDSDASHTAWRVETREELQAWRKRLEDLGVEIMYQIEHEIVESIYFRDPNGYYIEIGTPVRDIVPLDLSDAEVTMRAAIEAERALRQEGKPGLEKIASIYVAKGRMLKAELGDDA